MKKYISLIIAIMALGALPLLSTAQLVMNGGFYVVMSSGTQANPTSIVVTNPATGGITNNGSGWIISENEFNQVVWNIGTGTGSYVVPFGYTIADYLPVTCNITTAGTGASGKVKFSTYHGSSWDNGLYPPSDVTTVSDFGYSDFSRNMVDRFWEVDANTGYTTKPAATLKFSYIRSGAPSEIAAPNTITESSLIAQRFNSTLHQWSDFTGATGTDVTGGNTGNVSSGAVSPANLFRSWTLAKDTIPQGVATINGGGGTIITWPNPASQNINISFSGVEEGNAVISIADVIGRELITKNLRFFSGLVVPVDVSALPAGMYFIRLSGSTYTITSKFIRQ